MALQHLYSRVPARMSMFNRIDGYDTFACSEGLTYDFIQKELSSVCDIRISKNDIASDDIEPSVFCQFTAKSGELVQSCITHLGTDYTGERNAYLVHSLVLGDNELCSVLEAGNKLFNTGMFRNDLNGFDLCSPDSRSDKAYPEKPYLPASDADCISITGKYDPGMLKRAIYCLISAACAKGKNVYISFIGDDHKVASEGLEFINSIFRIFPKQIRRAIPLATYCDDYTKFGFAKLKVIRQNSAEVPVAKGISLHMGAKLTVGLDDKFVQAKGQLVEFFYGLLSDEAVRLEFLRFADTLTSANPDFETLNIKELENIVLLFMQSSGHYSESAILPDDDKLYDFLTVYEKYSRYMPDDYCARAVTCFRRYPSKNLPLPKNIFSKMSKIYPKECFASKRIIIDVVLDLIHTDVMRDKLFGFIKNNYSGEDAEIRARINENLSRVYYGGFMQPQIAEFFTANYPDEPENIQEIITEKMCLTVRTPEVQDIVLGFFDANYSVMPSKQKNMFYEMAFEQLQFNDELPVKLIRMLNDKLEGENEELTGIARDGIIRAVEEDCRRREPHVFGLIIKARGRCLGFIQRQLLTDWNGKKIFSYYLNEISVLPVSDKIALAVSAWESTPDMNEMVYGKVLYALLTVNEDEKYDLLELLELDKYMTEKLTGSRQKLFADRLRSGLIYTGIRKSINQVFGVKDGNGLELLAAYAENNPQIAESKEYECVGMCLDLLSRLESSDISGAFTKCGGIDDKQTRLDVSGVLKKWLTTADCGNEAKFAAYTLITMLEKNKIVLFDSYKKLLGKAIPKNIADEEAFEPATAFVSDVLNAANKMYVAEISDELHSSLLTDASELRRIVSDYLSKYGKNGKKKLQSTISAAGFDPDFESYCGKLLKEIKTDNGGFFSKLFGKK